MVLINLRDEPFIDGALDRGGVMYVKLFDLHWFFEGTLSKRDPYESWIEDAERACEGELYRWDQDHDEGEEGWNYCIVILSTFWSRGWVGMSLDDVIRAY